MSSDGLIRKGSGDPPSKGLNGPSGRGAGAPPSKGTAPGHHSGHARSSNATKPGATKPGGVKHLWTGATGAVKAGSAHFRPDAAMSYGKASAQEAGGSGALLLSLLGCCLCCFCCRRVRRARELRAAKHAELTEDMEEALERAAAEAPEQKS
jgi:hypothetical protein